MTEEIDSIAPVGAQAPLGVSAASDVLPPVSASPRTARPQRRAATSVPERATESPEPSPASSARGELAHATQAGQSGQAGQPGQRAVGARGDSIEESLKRINARLASTDRVMQLRVDAGTGITVAEIRNSVTGQVLQQIPSTDVVHLAAMLSGWAHGKSILLDLIA